MAKIAKPTFVGHRDIEQISMKHKLTLFVVNVGSHDVANDVEKRVTAEREEKEGRSYNFNILYIIVINILFIICL